MPFCRHRVGEVREVVNNPSLCRRCDSGTMYEEQQPLMFHYWNINLFEHGFENPDIVVSLFVEILELILFFDQLMNDIFDGIPRLIAEVSLCLLYVDLVIPDILDMFQHPANVETKAHSNQNPFDIEFAPYK